MRVRLHSLAPSCQVLYTAYSTMGYRAFADSVHISLARANTQDRPCLALVRLGDVAFIVQLSFWT